MLIYDETPALAGRARTAAKAVLGLLLEEQRAPHFVYDYSSTYFRQGIAGEAEHRAELFSAIERESLLLIAARIERDLPHAMNSVFTRLREPEAIAAFRHAFLTYLGGTLAWDSDEREGFRKDLAMYLRLASRESRAMVRRPNTPRIGGAFVDRCAFLLDPSMMAQAREAAARFQVQLENCAAEALRAAFGRFRLRPAPALRRIPGRVPAPRTEPERKSSSRRPARAKLKSKPKPKIKPKPRTKSRRRVRQRAKPEGKPRRAPRVGRKPVAKPRAKPKPKWRQGPKARPISTRKRQRIASPARAKGKSRPRRLKTSPGRKPSQRAKPVKRPARSARKPKRSRGKK